MIFPTDHLIDAHQRIITMIEALISNDHAYLADNGDVYYDVSSFPDYGQLSGKNPADSA